MRVFVVWEPVIVTDLLPPGAGTLARLPDPRVVQYWDRSRALSAVIVAEAARNPGWLQGETIGKRDVAWDLVALYPSGARWESAFPAPALARFPVVDGADAVETLLASWAPAAP